MPALRCAVVGCDTVQDDSNSNNVIQVLPFPIKEDAFYEEWVRSTGRSHSWVPTAEDGVCSLHIRKQGNVPTKYLYNGVITDKKLWDVKYLEKISGALWTSPVLAEPREAGLSSCKEKLSKVEWSEVQRVAKMLGEEEQRFLRRLRTYHRLLAQVKQQRGRALQPRWARLLGGARRLPPGGARRLPPGGARRLPPGGAASGGAAPRGAAGPRWRALAAAARAGALPAEGAWRAVWARGARLARARLALLAAVGDDAGALAPAARPAWHVEDVVMLQAGAEERVALPPAAAARYMTRVALATLLELVQQYDLEAEHAPILACRWESALQAYRARHRAASLVLLQRRWYELKLAVHASPDHPELHAAVAARYPDVRGAAPRPWPDLLAAGALFTGTEPEHDPDPAVDPDPELAPPLVALLPAPGTLPDSDSDDDDDVVCIERKIETLEISDDEREQSPLPPPPPPPSSPPPILITKIKSEVDVKLTLTPKVVVRELTSVEGWNVREGKYVSLNELKLEDLVPTVPGSASPPVRPVASRLVFEEDDLESVLASNRIENATLEIAFDDEEEENEVETRSERDSRRVRLPDIEQVRRSHRSALTAQVSPTVVGEGPGEGAEGARGGAVVCCWALRDRAANAARARNWAAAGRAPPALRLPYHEAHCRPPCACCCRGAQWGWAGAPLALRQLALDKRLDALWDPAPPAPPAAARRTKHTPHGKTHEPGTCKPRSRTRRKRAVSPPRAPSPARDPLQEWIRQRNITNRFFDLNLRPPPQKLMKTKETSGKTTDPPANSTKTFAETVDTGGKTTETSVKTTDDDNTAVRDGPTQSKNTTNGYINAPKRISDDTITLEPTMTVSDDEEQSSPASVPAANSAPPPTPSVTPALASTHPPISTPILPLKDMTLSSLLSAPQATPRVPPVAPVSIVTMTQPSRHKSVNTPVLVIRPLSTTAVKVKSASAIATAPLPRPPPLPTPVSTPAALPRPARLPAPATLPTLLPAPVSASAAVSASASSSPQSTPPPPSLLRAPSSVSTSVSPVAVSVATTDPASTSTSTSTSVSTDVPGPASAPHLAPAASSAERPAPLLEISPINRSRFEAVPCGDGEQFEEPTIKASELSWVGRPLVVGVCGAAAPWGPLLGWYLVSGRRAARAAPVDWYVVCGGRLNRVLPRPPAGVRALWGVRSAREGARLARDGAPLLALQVRPARALRVSVQRAPAALHVRCAYALLARRIAAAFNDDDDGAALGDFIALDDDDDD